MELDEAMSILEMLDDLQIDDLQIDDLQIDDLQTVKPRIRVYAGAQVTEAMIAEVIGVKAKDEVKAENKAPAERWAESTADAHKVGGICPHCKGTGRYVLHTKGGNNRCYRCHGKGRLDRKDMAYMERRLQGSGPLCWVVTAA